MKYFQCALNALWVFTAASKENCDIGDMKTLTVCSILDFFFQMKINSSNYFLLAKISNLVFTNSKFALHLSTLFLKSAQMRIFVSLESTNKKKLSQNHFAPNS